MPDLNKFEELRRPFHPDEVKNRVQAGMKLSYVPIENTIARFLEVFEDKWDWVITRSTLETVYDDKGKAKYTSIVEGHIQIREDGYVIKRGGVGAGVSNDPDTAIKTADAEALKKASNKFGVALQLWDETERDGVEAYRTENVKDLKALVAKRVKDAGGQVTRPGIAAFFGVSEDDLDNVTMLKELAWEKP